MCKYGKIINIEDFDIFETCEGYRITTDKTVIEFGIDSMRHCCESWGYFSSDDDFSRFVGKEISSIDLDSEKEGSYEIPEDVGYLEYGGIRFVTIHTTDGDSVQFAVYNAHNGYYGHEIFIRIGNETVVNDCL